MQIPRRGTALILSCGLLASLPALAPMSRATTRSRCVPKSARKWRAT